jgi:hypothetical protein
MVQLRTKTSHFFSQIAGDDCSRNISEDIHKGLYLSLFVQRPDNRIPVVPLCHAANKGILPNLAPVFP